MDKLVQEKRIPWREDQGSKNSQSNVESSRGQSDRYLRSSSNLSRKVGRINCMLHFWKFIMKRSGICCKRIPILSTRSKCLTPRVLTSTSPTSRLKKSAMKGRLRESSRRRGRIE